MTGEITAPPTWRERSISDEEVQHLADEAEAGYDPARLRQVARAGSEPHRPDGWA